MRNCNGFRNPTRILFVSSLHIMSIAFKKSTNRVNNLQNENQIEDHSPPKIVEK